MSGVRATCRSDAVISELRSHANIVNPWSWTKTCYNDAKCNHFWRILEASFSIQTCTFCAQKVCQFFKHPNLTSLFFIFKDMINSSGTNIILSVQLCSMAWLITDMLKNPMGKCEKIHMKIAVNATNAHLDLDKLFCKFNAMMYNIRINISICDQECSMAWLITDIHLSW